VALVLGLPRERVIALTNVDKYREAKAPHARSARTVRVFELMRRVNQAGLSDPSLGADASGRDSFRDTLNETLDDLAVFLRGRPVRYVELGPEPVKTSAILDGLRLRGVAVESYLGIDVNPASPARMAPALRRRLAAEKIAFRLLRYQDLEPLGREGDTINLVTMLGFEEGNEDPRDLGALLGRLMAPGDMLLSEMQVCDGGWDAVQRFYTCPTMRRFSRLALESKWTGLNTRFGVMVVPVEVGGLGNLAAAVTLEKVVQPGHYRDGTVIVTNVCLKPGGKAFRALRSRCGPFRVLAQNATGDRSISFQVSDRV
jgi:hypothetical protein